MTNTLNDSEFRRYALIGAEARLLQIDQETATIYQAFPELRKESGAQLPQPRRSDAAAAGPGGRRNSMTTAQREAVRERMKRYWAQRRGESVASGAAASGSDTTAAGDADVAAATKKAKGSRGARGPRKMSAAARKRISDAQKARWAKRRRANA